MPRSAQVVLIPIRFPIVRPGEDLNRAVGQALQTQRIRLENGDILAVASKLVSLCENRVVKLCDVSLSPRARRFAKKWKMDPRLVSTVIQEADSVLGGVRGFLLTVKDGIMTANAGVDVKNSPAGTATLWPASPFFSARQLRRYLRGRGLTRLGVEIVDSRVTPLRLGTIGLAIGLSGFRPVTDFRGRPDLYGRQVKVTQVNLADDLAAAAHMLMGEAKERVGAVVIRNANVNFDKSNGTALLKLKPAKCLITNGLTRRPSKLIQRIR